MKKNFLKEFEQFEKNARIQVNEMQKISGGTCTVYSSCSFGDCDTDDCTFTYGPPFGGGGIQDTDNKNTDPER